MKVPYTLVPVAIVLVTVASLWSTHLFSIPTLTVVYGEPAGDVRTAHLLVQGVKCKDTAKRAASSLEDTPGLLRCVAYASYNRMEIDYEPGRISMDEIREMLEGPVYAKETGEFLFHQFKVIEIDGRSPNDITEREETP